MQDYLCNRLYSLPEAGIERYLSQLCHLMVTRPGSSLERVMVDLCARSLRVACKVHLRPCMLIITPNCMQSPTQHSAVGRAFTLVPRPKEASASAIARFLSIHFLHKPALAVYFSCAHLAGCMHRSCVDSFKCIRPNDSCVMLQPEALVKLFLSCDKHVSHDQIWMSAKKSKQVACVSFPTGVLVASGNLPGSAKEPARGRPPGRMRASCLEWLLGERPHCDSLTFPWQ